MGGGPGGAATPPDAQGATVPTGIRRSIASTTRVPGAGRQGIAARSAPGVMPACPSGNGTRRIRCGGTGGGNVTAQAAGTAARSTPAGRRSAEAPAHPAGVADAPGPTTPAGGTQAGTGAGAGRVAEAAPGPDGGGRRAGPAPHGSGTAARRLGAVGRRRPHSEAGGRPADGRAQQPAAGAGGAAPPRLGTRYGGFVCACADRPGGSRVQGQRRTARVTGPDRGELDVPQAGRRGPWPWPPSPCGSGRSPPTTPTWTRRSPDG